MIKKYKKDDEYSYSLGTELTLELLIQHSDLVKNIYVHSKQIKNEIFNRIVTLANQKHIDIIYNDKVFNILSDKENCYIIGVFKKYISKINPASNHLVLANPANTGNLGTIIRTSIGFGICDIAIIKPAVDHFDPRVIRASMGAIFEANIQLFDSFAQYLENVDKRNIYPFMLDGANQLDEIAIPLHYSLVFGNEASGLDSSYKNYGQPVLIKHYKTIDSLNLCNAVSIGLYQFTKGKIQ